MPIQLIHLGRSDLLTLLLVLLGVPALVLRALAWAVYGGLTTSRESFTIINPEKNLEPNDEGGGRGGRA